MADSHFVSALRQRWADRLGELEQARLAIAGLEAEEAAIAEKLTHLEAMIRDEAPELLLETIKPRKPRAPKPDDAGGTRMPLSKAILRTLRLKKKAMSAREVRDALREDYADQGDVKLLRNVSTILSVKKTAGLLSALQTDDGILRYQAAA